MSCEAAYSIVFGLRAFECEYFLCNEIVHK